MINSTKDEVLESQMNLGDTTKKKFVLGEKAVKALFALPIAIWVILVLEGPFLFAIDKSLREYNLGDPIGRNDWIGLGNYRQLMHDNDFWNSVWVTLKFAVPAVFLEVTIGLALALFLYRTINGKSKLGRLVLALLLVPMMASEPVVSLIWQFLLQPDYGVLTYILRLLGGPQDIDFLSNINLVLPTLVLVDVWQWVPFVAIIMYAGFVALPKVTIESAILDGASYWRRVRYIIIPPVLPLLSVVILFRSILAFNVMGKVLLMTGGGPGSHTQVVSLYAYRQAFRSLDQGYASAIVVTMFVFVFLITDLWFTFIYSRVTGK